MKKRGFSRISEAERQTHHQTQPGFPSPLPAPRPAHTPATVRGCPGGVSCSLGCPQSNGAERGERSLGGSPPPAQGCPGGGRTGMGQSRGAGPPGACPVRPPPRGWHLGSLARLSPPPEQLGCGASCSAAHPPWPPAQGSGSERGRAGPGQSARSFEPGAAGGTPPKHTHTHTPPSPAPSRFLASPEPGSKG